jgi:PAS domain S-box-containing protein
MLLVAKSGIITYQNAVCSRLFGYDDSELLGKTIETLVPETSRGVHSILRSILDKKSLPRPMGSGLQVHGRRKDGTEIPVDVSLNIHGGLHRSQIIVGVVDLSEHQENLERLKASRARLRDLTAHMTRLTERERKSIARDLHDDLGQVLTSLKIDTAILGRKLDACDDFHDAGTISEDLAAMSDTLDSANDRLHGFISRLRPEVLDNLGLITALEWQTEEFSRRSSIESNFVSSLESITVDDEAAIAVFRILQECLTNIVRHSEAHHVVVKIDRVENCLVVEVSDDGIGIPADMIASTKRFGLLGVKERASALHGDVNIESIPGKGTTVRTTIPLEPGGTNRD